MTHSPEALAQLPPAALRALLGAKVEVDCASGASHRGRLCSADPHSGLLALLQARPSASSLHLHLTSDTPATRNRRTDSRRPCGW